MNTVTAQAETRNTRPLLLLSDPRFASTRLRSSYDGELQTEQELYLAEVIAMTGPNSRTTRLSVTVTHASDGTTLSYNKLIAKMRLRKDGSTHHSITVPGIGARETISEAVQLVLADAAARREGQVAM